MNDSSIHMNSNKPITREDLKKIIEKCEHFGNWKEVENANVSEVTDMSSLFYQVKGIKDLDLSKWDTSKVTDMSYMFNYSNLNKPLHFDTSNVENMKYMFADSKYNQPLNFDTSKVKNMYGMFGNSIYNQPLNFNTSNVKDMGFMFYNSKYNQPLNFDTSNVTDMCFIFSESLFNQDISDWIIQDTEDNQDVIKYRDECLKKRVEKEAIEASIKNNKNKSSCTILKL